MSNADVTRTSAGLERLDAAVLAPRSRGRRPALGLIRFAWALMLLAMTGPLVGAAMAAAGDTTPSPGADSTAVAADDHARAASADTSDLGPTSQPPWNPPRPMARRRMWEQIVLLPERIVSLPLSGLGYVSRAVLLRAEDSGMIPLGKRAATTRPVPMLAPPRLGDRTGLGGAVVFNGPTPYGLPRLSARYAATLLGYSSSRVAASLGPATLQYGFDWRPQDRFYGVGTSTSRDSLADFGAQDDFVQGILHWGASPDSVGGRRHLGFSAWGGPRSLVTRTGRDTKEVSYQARFPALGDATLDRRVEHLVYGGSVLGDWRSGRPHWSHGGRLSLAVERYDTPMRALALNSSRLDGARFTRYSVETEGGMSFMRDPRTIRLLVRLTDQTVDSGRDHFLISDMARIGGRDGLAGYGPGRFHDLDLLHARLMYLFPLARLFEFEVHSEWGAVYPDIWRDAKLRTLRHSFGVSLRARSDVMPHAALGFDVSPEGVRIRYAVGGVE